MTPTPMPYVKFHTKIVSSPRWRATPPSHRFVFMSLIVLAGANGTPGYVRGSDGDIAALLGCARGVVTRAVTRYSSDPDPSLTRTQAGIEIVNWRLYQPTYSTNRREENRREEKTNPQTLKTLPEGREWWDELAKKFPSVDLLAELQKAGDWHGAAKVKSPRLYFRNWVERAAKNAPAAFDLPDLSREEARVG